MTEESLGRWGGSMLSKRLQKNKIESTKERSATELRFASFRVRLWSDMGSRQGSRWTSLRDALDSSPCHPRSSMHRGKNNKDGRHVGPWLFRPSHRSPWWKVLRSERRGIVPGPNHIEVRPYGGQRHDKLRGRPSELASRSEFAGCNIQHPARFEPVAEHARIVQRASAQRPSSLCHIVAGAYKAVCAKQSQFVPCSETKWQWHAGWAGWAPD